MSDLLKRRNFIKNISLAGISFAIANPVHSNQLHKTNDDDKIKNDHFTVSFDKRKGVINIYRSNGIALVSGSASCINLAKQNDNNPIKYLITSENFKHTSRSTEFADQLGTGKKLIIISKDRNKRTDLEIHVSLYDHAEAITIEAICKNVSGRDIVVHSIEPFRAIKNEGGIMNVPGVSKCLTNGEMYFDTGTIHEFGKNDHAVSSGHLKGIKLANGPISSPTETIHSWWNAGLFSGYDKEGWVLGYLENDACLGNLLITKTAVDEISFIAESVCTPALLKTGKTISSNRLMISTAADPYTALEFYAQTVGKINNARIHSILNGWCSWFYTLSQVSENEVLHNAAFASQHLKPFGLEYIQIDEGYQRWHGDWEGNERFPHGMKWLAGKIREYGFKPGLWISPYVISEPTEVFQKHPGWLLKKADGSLKRIGNWEEGTEPPADENPKRYGLDITNPEAAKWLYDLIDTIVNNWGYEMIKIDFIAWSILAADHYQDPAASFAQVYRKGMEIIRKAAGDKCHILECGPGAVSVGLFDSMRIEADVNYGFSEAAWDTYFLHEASSASAVAKRFYFHKRTWINDADHICLELLADQQAEAAATIIALSGGNMFSGDRLTQLDAYKLEILKKITPSFGEAAKAVDLFDSDKQSVFAVKIKKSFTEWTVVGFFNTSLTESTEKKISLKRLWLDPNKTYLAFDFWRQQFIGEVSGEIKLTVQPGSVSLLALHEKKDNPQFISTSRHILQGAVEMEDVYWDENTKTLYGTSIGPLGSSHNVFVYIPEPHPWSWTDKYVLFNDYDSYNLKLIDKNIIKVHVIFKKGDHVHWQIKPDEFFKS